MTLLTALELAGNYPDNILVTTAQAEGKFAIMIYMTRNGGIHKLMLSGNPVYDTEQAAKDDGHKACQAAVDYINKKDTANPVGA